MMILNLRGEVGVAVDGAVVVDSVLVVGGGVIVVGGVDCDDILP